MEGNNLTKKETSHNLRKSKLSGSELCLDLSNQCLKEFPVTSTMEAINLQGNFLEKLQVDFFHMLPSLRHLDLRQNALVEIPKSIAGHNSLEVLLLQDNKLTALPFELGQVPRLRKLQYSGNPLIWPPPNILSGGLESILSCLRDAFMEMLSIEDSDVLKANDYDLEKKCTEDDDTGDMSTLPVFELTGDVSKSPDSLSILKTGENISTPSSLFKAWDSSKFHDQEKLKPQEASSLVLIEGKSKKLKRRFNSINSKVASNQQKSPALKPQVLPGHALAIMNGQCFPLGYKKRTSPSTEKVYKMLLKKVWLSQLKCILQSQDHALQRQKTSEALRQWRQEAKSLQRSSSYHTWTGLNFPFDYDSNCLGMLSRADLLMFQNKSLEKKGHSKPDYASSIKTRNLQEKINEILQSYDELKVNSCNTDIDSADTEPSIRCKLLAEEMRQISSLQKAVQALRLSN